MNTTLKPKDVHVDIAKQARQKSDAGTRTIDKMVIGESIRQGDIYVRKISSVVLAKDFTLASSELQLAKGSTKGSRHILESNPSLKMFTRTSPSPLQGPGFTSLQKVTITHPEHAHFVLPAGSYDVTYQRDFTAEEIMAVKD